MLAPQLLPSQWRADKGLSLAAAAALVGVTGKNPGRTWHRWETGVTEPPFEIVLKVESLSDGRVTIGSWVAAQAEARGAVPQ